MNIWVLSQLEGSPGTRLFLEAASRRGHSAERIHPLDLDIGIRSEAGLSIAHRGRPRELPDVCFTRMGASSPPEGLNVLVHLEGLGVPVLNASVALWRSRDKLRALSLLSSKGLPVPSSLGPGRLSPPQHLETYLGPPPWVVKLPEGSKGEGVFLVHGVEELEGLRGKLPPGFLVQTFVRESYGVDVRVLVVGGRALAAMRRTNSDGDFRSNLAQGGRGETLPLTPQLEELAVSATRVLGLDISGVDFIESASGPLIVEVNGSPGFAGIESATGLDLSGEVVNFLQLHAEAHRAKHA